MLVGFFATNETVYKESEAELIYLKLIKKLLERQ